MTTFYVPLSRFDIFMSELFFLSESCYHVSESVLRVCFDSFYYAPLR